MLELKLNREPKMNVAPNDTNSEARYWLDIVLPYFAPGLLLRCPKAMLILNETATQDFICGFSNRLWVFSDNSHIIASEEGQRIF
jgi:hypothetical protein